MQGICAGWLCVCQDSAGRGEDIQEELPKVGCCKEKVMELGLDPDLMSGG